MALLIYENLLFIIMITVLSVNVGGLRVTPRSEEILHEIAKQKTDFVLIQETHLDEIGVIKAYFPHAGVYHSPSGSSHTRGVCIIARSDPQPIQTIIDPTGRYVILRVIQNSQECMLVNVYAPSGSNVAQERLNFFHKLARTVPNPGVNELVFLGGDFNMVESPKDIHPSPSHFTPCKFLPGLQHLIHALNVEDKWRLLNPHSNECTHQARPDASHTRIDRVYLTRWLADEFRIHHEAFTVGGHYNAVHVKVEMKGEPAKGRGFWHFNNSLTEDQDYCQRLKIWWTNWQEEKDQFPNLPQ